MMEDSDHFSPEGDHDMTKAAMAILVSCAVFILGSCSSRTPAEQRVTRAQQPNPKVPGFPDGIDPQQTSDDPNYGYKKSNPIQVGGPEGFPRHTASSGPTVAALNTTANNHAANPDERCISVFMLFRQFIKPGSTPQQIHEVLTNTEWLEQTNILGIYFLAGWIPVQWDYRNETPFAVSVLPSIKPPVGTPPNLGYHIYITLSGRARSEKSAFAMLTGQSPLDPKARLMEFALCYPDGTIEHISKGGVQKFNQFSHASSNSGISVPLQWDTIGSGTTQVGSSATPR
jgi:hypothetical protein